MVPANDVFKIGINIWKISETGAKIIKKYEFNFIVPLSAPFNYVHMHLVHRQFNGKGTPLSGFAGNLNISSMFFCKFRT